MEILEWLIDKRSIAAIILISGHGKYYTKTASHLASIKGGDILGTLTKPFELVDLEVPLQRGLAAHETQTARWH